VPARLLAIGLDVTVQAISEETAPGQHPSANSKPKVNPSATTKAGLDAWG